MSQDNKPRLSAKERKMLVEIRKDMQAASQAMARTRHALKRPGTEELILRVCQGRKGLGDLALFLYQPIIAAEAEHAKAWGTMFDVFDETDTLDERSEP